jgi:cell division protein FtsA
MSDAHFALDIGTRTVVGLIVTGEPLEIKSACVCEHQERSMHDGQIHDVEKVAEVVLKVKNELEEEIGYKLTKASVAVAGRALKTAKSKISVEIPYKKITEKDLKELEFEAVAKANCEFSADERLNCVGYSIISYELDGDKMSSVLGHTGSSVTIELLATFLPESVVNSMFAVLDRCGLEALSVTLEPIAALNIAIPHDMRKLNLALVDIGAGTSDIAITNDGAVIGYGMVPEAGDEITDFICDHYLVDFSTGEEIKRNLASSEQIEVKDIFGISSVIKTSEIISVVAEEIDKLSRHIAEEIISINGKTPRAVILVGGGSQTATLKEQLAKHLNIPVQRIGSRLPNMVDGLEDNTGKVTGAEMITPLGIALTAVQNTGIDFIEVTVNDTSVHLMDLNGLSIMDALVAARIKHIYSRPGMALSLNVNSRFMTIEGEFGQHSSVLLDGKNASLGDSIIDGSNILFQPPVNGKDASISIDELVSKQGIETETIIVLNGEKKIQHPTITVNGKKAKRGMNLPDRASVIIDPASLLDVLHDWKDVKTTDKITITVNNRPRTLDKINYSISSNDTPVPHSEWNKTIIKNDDVIDLEVNQIDWTVNKIVDEPVQIREFAVILNNENIVFPETEKCILVNGQKANLSDKISDGDDIKIKNGSDVEPILSDLFEFMDINREELVGKNIRLLVNDIPARFTTPLKNGNKVTIEFIEV